MIIIVIINDETFADKIVLIGFITEVLAHRIEWEGDDGRVRLS